MTRRKNRDRLVDHVVAVRLHLLDIAPLDQLHHPPRVEVDAEADPPPVLGQVLDRQPQSPGSRGAQHQPVRPLRETGVGQRVAEVLVVGLPVVNLHSTLRDARRAPRLEHVHTFAFQARRDPPLNRSPTQPLVFKRGELAQVLERVHRLARVETQRLGPLQPERTPRRRVEVPLHHVPDMGVQFLFGTLQLGSGRRGVDSTHGGTGLGGGIARLASARLLKPEQTGGRFENNRTSPMDCKRAHSFAPVTSPGKKNSGTTAEPQFRS